MADIYQRFDNFLSLFWIFINWFGNESVCFLLWDELTKSYFLTFWIFLCFQFLYKNNYIILPWLEIQLDIYSSVLKSFWLRISLIHKLRDFLVAFTSKRYSNLLKVNNLLFWNFVANFHWLKYNDSFLFTALDNILTNIWFLCALCFASKLSLIASWFVQYSKFTSLSCFWIDHLSNQESFLISNSSDTITLIQLFQWRRENVRVWDLLRINNFTNKSFVKLHIDTFCFKTKNTLDLIVFFTNLSK